MMDINPNNGIFISPNAKDPSDIPDISFSDYILQYLRKSLPHIKEKSWLENVGKVYRKILGILWMCAVGMILPTLHGLLPQKFLSFSQEITGIAFALLGNSQHDILNGQIIKFGEVEDLTKRIGSALTRHGFKKGDVLFYVTFDATMIFVIHLAVWRLGGITWGWYQNELPEFYAKIMKFASIKYLLIDEETAPVILKASADLKWPVKVFSFDAIEGAIPVSKLLEDDGAAFPEHVDIKPREDILFIMSTSGSTGMPKGVMHTHYNGVALFNSIGVHYTTEEKCQTLLSPTMNFAGGSFSISMSNLLSGNTIYCLPKFDRNTYFELILQHKPDVLTMHPCIGVWFARHSKLKTCDLSFLKQIRFGGAVLDFGTLDNIREALPNVYIRQHYGQTETMTLSTSSVDSQYPVVFRNFQGGNHIVSSGKLAPFVEAKIVDVDTRETLPPGKEGEVLVQAPYFMVGYFGDDQKKFDEMKDKDGWMLTGDLGFFDVDGNLFIIERLNTYFKYYGYPVMPIDIEAVLQNHESVHAAAVVGIPNVETDNLARAFVVLRPGCHTTADELQKYVADRLPEMKHLHGGVRFIDALPENRNAKLDRIALRKYAIEEKSK